MRWNGEEMRRPMGFGQTGNDRFGAAALTLLIEALLAWALIAGLRMHAAPPHEEAMKLFEIAPEPVPPPDPVRPAPPATRAPEGAASPPNLRSVATPVVAPPPAVVLPLPSPIVAAPDPGIGSDPSAGAADVRGPGSGSGGIGDGTGSGRGGYGPGGGGGRGTPPRRLRGRLSDSDYPRWADEAGIGGTVSVIFAVQVDGRVTDCEITGSSGYPRLDDFTCRLIEQRYRYRPSLDRQGRPVRSRVIEDHEWVIQDMPPDRDVADRYR